MDSFEEEETGGSVGFRYHPDTDSDEAASVLDLYVHHARDIHNICIYANQDVYAKFSLTCSPDDALSTRVVNGGGRNPQFDESLRFNVPQPDTTVLKCEIWMLSRVRNYLEDQLLGFALVPLSLVAAADGRRLTQDFSLSSTDLFHSPAGTVQLTLSLDEKAFAESNPTSSITSEVVLLDPAEYGRIEFPDVNTATENQQMVSEYFDRPAGTAELAVPFLHLGTFFNSIHDYEMGVANSGDETNSETASPEAIIQNSGMLSSSTTTSLSEDRNLAESAATKKKSNNTSTSAANKTSPDTPTSKGQGETTKADDGDGGREDGKGGKIEPIKSVFESPMGGINIEAEQSAMQQQIVDMYMRSMQQFTESLAKMKLPMDLDIPKTEDGGNIIQSQDSKLQPQKKKDGARVFYGSRAFF